MRTHSQLEHATLDLARHIWQPSKTLVLSSRSAFQDNYDKMADKEEEEGCLEAKPLKAAVGQPRSVSHWTFWLLYSTACVLLSSLQFGYNTTCINAPEEVLHYCLFTGVTFEILSTLAPFNFIPPSFSH